MSESTHIRYLLDEMGRLIQELTDDQTRYEERGYTVACRVLSQTCVYLTQAHDTLLPLYEALERQQK